MDVGSGDDINELSEIVSAPLTEGTAQQRKKQKKGKKTLTDDAGRIERIGRRNTSAVRVDFEREGRSVFGQRVVIFAQLLEQLLQKKRGYDWHQHLLCTEDLLGTGHHKSGGVVEKKTRKEEADEEIAGRPV